MTTIGDLIDRLSILEKRIDVKLSSLDTIKKKQVESGMEEQAYLDANETQKNEAISLVSAVNDLHAQRGWLLLSFAEIILDMHQNKHPGVFSKHKNYDPEVVTEISGYLLDSIHNLSGINNILWELEDTRRNKSLSDTERLKAADDVAVFNKRRNDVIDNINDLVTYSINLLKENKDG